jgi:Tfp pilus assembly protein PilN
MKTNRLSLEFAPDARRVSRVGVAMLVVCAVVLAGSGLRFAQLLGSNSRLENTLAALDARRSAGAENTKRSAPSDPAALARARAVRRVAQNLTTPWSDMLESLEAAPSQSVALLSVEPSVAKRSVRITAEARNPQDMLDYLSALQQDARLSSVLLTSHQIQDRVPGAPVRFQIQANWGAAP